MKFILLAMTLIAAGSVVAESIPPTREISVIVTAEGYYPKQFTVFQGERVKFYLTSTVDKPDCMIIQGHKVFLAATKGKVTEGETVFEHPGTFAFYCPASKHDGKITVIQKGGPTRGIASDPALWTPKEYE